MTEETPVVEPPLAEGEPAPNAAPDPPSSPGAPVPAGPGPANASPETPAAATGPLAGCGVRIPVLP